MKRYPTLENDPLQAWDAADELMLDHVRSMDLAGKRIVILNDFWGALSRGLPAREAQGPVSYTDSYVSTRAIALNSDGRVAAVNRLEDLSGPFDLALVRIPKNMSFFEDELCRLSQLLRPGAPVICGYMIKYQSKASFDLLNRLIGPTTTSLARKKARLILAALDRPPTRSPYPKSVPLDGFALPFTHASGLFSRDKLDIGTRFFLEHIPQGDFRSIVDLGCANGAIGIAAKLRNPNAKIIFTDDSMMAIESARTNYAAHFADAAEFYWTNCFENAKPASVDLVLCNPPFHQGGGMTDQVACQMFEDAHRALRPGGVLRVIGNSHLRYAQSLTKIFGKSERVAANSKFIITDAFR